MIKFPNGFSALPEFSISEVGSSDLKWLNHAVASGYTHAYPISGDLTARDNDTTAMEVPC